MALLTPTAYWANYNSGSISPSDIPNLAGWYDASDTGSYVMSGPTIVGIRSKNGYGDELGVIGNSNPTAGTQQNGLDTLYFDSSTAFENVTRTDPLVSSDGVHFAVGVFYPQNVTQQQDSIWSVNATRDYAVSAYGSNSWLGELDLGNGVAADGIIGPYGNTNFENSWIIVSVVFTKIQGATNYVIFTINGSNGSNWRSVYTSNLSGDQQLRIMANRTGNRKQEGRFGELLLYRGEAGTTANFYLYRQMAEGYLAHKWGLAGNLPPSHPYKSVAPNSAPTISYPSQTINTNYNYAVDFNGSNQYLQQNTTDLLYKPIGMGGNINTVSSGITNDNTYTSNDTNSRPWACGVMFLSKGNASNQYVWNYGEGAPTGGDNIYLRISSSGTLIFGWGRVGSNPDFNECEIINLSPNTWYGCYIAHTGQRVNATNANATNLTKCFDIRIYKYNGQIWDLYIDSLSNANGQRCVVDNWISTGRRMDQSFQGRLYVGGRGNTGNFYGQVASMSVVTLINNSPMPNNDFAFGMACDPYYITQIIIGNQYRKVAEYANAGNYQSNLYRVEEFQFYLMGDITTRDSYSNGIRNWTDMNDLITKLDFVNMPTDAIESINIPGLTGTAVPPPTNIQTDWTKGIAFDGVDDGLQQVDSSSARVPVRMSNLSTTVPQNSISGSSYTSNDSNSRPWATSVVFQSTTSTGNQHIWNVGEGTGTTDDNIYLRRDANLNLWFGWGRSGATELNECYIGNSNIYGWYGVYIASNGTRLGSGHTAAQIADCFDIRLTSANSNWVIGSNLSTTANWTNGSFGGRMDYNIGGEMNIGGRGTDRNFLGRIAAYVSTTLRQNQPMPDSTEIRMIITDPKKWLNNYRVGNRFRLPWQGNDTNFNFSLNDGSSAYSAQVWLMGDGTNDSYTNGIRNQVKPTDVTYTKLNFEGSMASEDIETVNIPGLT